MYLLIDSKKFMELSYLVFIFSLLTCSITLSQSIMGYNGLFRIPTANKNNDREVSFAFAYVDKRISVLENGISPNSRAFISMNYLPFLEINIILNNLVHSDSPQQANGDRQSSFKLILTDLGIFPNVAFGVYDALGSLEGGGVHSDFLYITSTKTFDIYRAVKVEMSMGYAREIYHVQSTGLYGLFGGIALIFFDSIKIYGEYDSQYYNFGTNIRLLNHIVLFGGFLEGKYFSGGAGFSFVL